MIVKFVIIGGGRGKQSTSWNLLDSWAPWILDLDKECENKIKKNMICVRLEVLKLIKNEKFGGWFVQLVVRAHSLLLCVWGKCHWHNKHIDIKFKKKKKEKN